MHLAIYIRSVESARGAERVAVNVARGLAARGHRVDFLVEESGDWLAQQVNRNGDDVRIIDLRAGRRGSLADRLLQAWVFATHLISSPRALLACGDACLFPVAQLLYKDAPPLAALRRYLREQQPRTVLSFLNYPNTVLLLTAQLHRGDTRFVVSVRNHMSSAATHNEFGLGAVGTTPDAPAVQAGRFRWWFRPGAWPMTSPLSPALPASASPSSTIPSIGRS